MKFLIKTLLILNALNVFAQEELIISSTDTLKMVECSQIVEGEVRDKITGDLLLEAIVTLIDADGNNIEIQRVDENATFSFKIKCETTYKLEGKKIDFTAESIDFNTTNEANKRLKLIIKLDKGNIDFIEDSKENKVEEDLVKVKEEVTKKEVSTEKLPKEPIDTKEEKNSLKIKPVYFDLASSYLSKKAKNQLKKTIVLMKKHPNMVIELSAHSDAQGSDKINNWFADRRLKRTIDYLTKRGINASRIKGKAYGATQLVNNCSKEIQCTDEQHAQNRRTEFIIIKM